MKLNAIMRGIIAAAGVGHSSTSGDQYWSNVVFMAHLTGDNGSTTLTDTSSVGFNPVIYSSPPNISNAQMLFGGNSLYFSGNGNAVRAGGIALNIGANDYTYEAWVYPIGTNHCGVFFTGHYYSGAWDFPGIGVRCFDGLTPYFYFSTNGSSSNDQAAASSVAMTQNQWNHVRMCVKSGVGYGFVNGKLTATMSGINPVADTGSTYGITLGRFPYEGSVFAFDGYLREVRMTIGVARSTTDFDVPTSPFPDHA